MVLTTILQKILERQVAKAGITVGDIWHDPDLAAALPAVRAGDITRARELLATGDPHLAAFRLNVLSSECTPHLDALEERYGDDDPLLLLLGGSARIKASWDIRGSGWAAGVGEDRFDRFHAFLEPAVGVLMRAAELAPEDPRPWNELQWYCLGMDIRREDLDRMWLELCSRDSWHHHGRYARLQVLCRKWRGSHEEMFAFARENAALAGPGDACLGLLPAAHKENIMLTVRDSEEIDTYGDVEEFVRGYFADPGVHGEVAGAADRWLSGDFTSDPEYVNVAHLFGAPLYYGGDLERAARVLAHAGRVLPEDSLWGHVSPWPPSDYRGALKACGLLDRPTI